MELMTSLVVRSWRGKIPDGAGTGRGTGAGIGRTGPGGAGPVVTRRSAGVEDGLDLGVGRVEQRVDVGVLVGQDGLDDGVEGRVELLGVDGRLGHDRLVEDLAR